MNIKRRIYRSIVSSAVMCIFFMQTVLQAAPAVYTIAISDEQGTVRQRYKGADERVIIHIQDAHSNFDAQINLAHIICSLLPQIDTGDVPFIGIEGAIGEYDLKELRDFPVQDIKKSVGEDFVRDGKFVGSELASIIANQDFRLFGLEDEVLFKKNFQAFYSVAEKQGALDSELAQIDDALMLLKSHIYNPDLIVFDKKAAQYESGMISVLDYMQILYQALQDARVPTESYMTFHQFKEVFAKQKMINFTMLKQEISTLAGLLCATIIIQVFTRYFKLHKLLKPDKRTPQFDHECFILILCIMKPDGIVYLNHFSQKTIKINKTVPLPIFCCMMDILMSLKRNLRCLSNINKYTYNVTLMDHASQIIIMHLINNFFLMTIVCA